MSEPISQLMSDIAEFRNMILYYENRILQKEIAIRELLDSDTVRRERKAELTVAEIVRCTIALPTTPARFTSAELTELCIAAYPGYDAGKITRGIRNVINDNLVPEGVLVNHAGVYEVVYN